MTATDKNVAAVAPQAVSRADREFPEEVRRMLLDPSMQSPAMSTMNNLRRLGALFDLLSPARTLEVGMAAGASAILFAGKHKEAGHTPAGQHVCIDPFQREYWKDKGRQNLEALGLDGYVTVHERLSSYVLPDLVEDGVTFDLIYIDGSHLFEDVFVDAYFCVQLLSRGGIMSFDDCSDPHVAKVIRFIETNLAPTLEPVEPPLDRAWKRRVARKLGRLQFRAFRKVGPAGRRAESTLRRF